MSSRTPWPIPASASRAASTGSPGAPSRLGTPGTAVLTSSASWPSCARPRPTVLRPRPGRSISGRGPGGAGPGDGPNASTASSQSPSGCSRTCSRAWHRRSPPCSAARSPARGRTFPASAQFRFLGAETRFGDGFPCRDRRLRLIGIPGPVKARAQGGARQHR